MGGKFTLKLNDVCEAIVDCEHKTAPVQDQGIPSIRTANIKNGRLDLESANKVSEATYKAWTKRLIPQPGDIILAREAPVGEVGIVPDDVRVCLGQRTVLIRPDKSIFYPRYLLYFLLTPAMRHKLERKAGGSTVSHLNMSDIRGLDIPEPPPLPVQQRIADVLGALDDKIEVNRRINRVLEQMAQALFRHWFVDFGPFQGGEFVESELGLIPVGWEVTALPEAIEVNPRRILSKGQIAPYLEMGNMPTSSPRALDWYNRSFNSGMRFVNGDVLVARITPCLENGKTAFVDFLPDNQTGWGSTEYIVLRCKPPLPEEFAYFLARSSDFRAYLIRHMTGTSGRQRASADCLQSFLLALPSETTARQFGELVKPVMLTIKQHDEESRKLAATRDYLLPRLLSGEVTVPEGEALLAT
jgi:type I restriction enzyme S subunit